MCRQLQEAVRQLHRSEPSTAYKSHEQTGMCGCKNGNKSRQLPKYRRSSNTKVKVPVKMTCLLLVGKHFAQHVFL